MNNPVREKKGPRLARSAIAALSGFVVALPAGRGSAFHSYLGYGAPVKGFELSPAKFAVAVAYRHEGYWLYFITLVYTLLVLWALVQMRIAPRLRTWVEGRSSRPWVQLLLYAPMLLLIFGALLLPTDTYGQWHSRRFGMSVQSWCAWFWDWTGAEIATVLGGTLVIGLLYFILRRSPRRWWFYVWLAGIPLAVLVVFIQPIAIDPLFNTFKPPGKTHPDLVNSAEKLLARAGLDIPTAHIYLAKVSDKTIAPNAYAEGLGPTKRIFVEDTIIANRAPRFYTCWDTKLATTCWPRIGLRSVFSFRSCWACFTWLTGFSGGRWVVGVRAGVFEVPRILVPCLWSH